VTRGRDADHDRPPRPRALRRYGQNHLVDANILRVILALAAVRPDDVVLEVGAAGGLLTERLAAQARAVHAFEIEGRFAVALEELAAKRPSLHLHLRDALKTRLDELSPTPTILVANLALQHRHPARLSRQSLPAVARSLGGDGAEGARGAPVCGAAGQGILSRVRARATRLRAHGAAAGVADGLLPCAARRLGLRHLQTAAGRAARRLWGRGGWCVSASASGARCW
jgi:hypothetical protein